MINSDRKHDAKLSLRGTSNRASVRLFTATLVVFVALYTIPKGLDAFGYQSTEWVQAVVLIAPLIAYLAFAFTSQRKITGYFEARGRALCNDGQVCPMCGHSVAEVRGPGACSECGTSYTNYGLSRYWEAVFKSGLYDYDRIILPLKDRPDPSD